MHYGEIKNCDIANGEGVRISLFVSGCTNHCENCFQPQTWDFDYGLGKTKMDGTGRRVQLIRASSISSPAVS